ncbi:nucleotide sugar dehydrogenase [archaeon]|jgi:UDP-N-acetyl-D-glucosamine/UDP-N-acetyl-D-galactosamine dehydrogenase|nr:nucleotide sugar dehydrogenase [archaeon]MBT4352335.1 nucleotide sugar dehydrogenase [archaeon]MBT4647087.1 nucleotide sugar dehydrogenase [archaeon]MBT6820996.1 nucleotide sugar dehydrogenase [archaeon]MBT7392681.1 nucleotide sugar dehydrogenase [archaeon]
MIPSINDTKIGIVGLGYVGLPLAIEFSKHFKVIGYDISKQKIESLKQGIDPGKETKKVDIDNSGILFTDDQTKISQCNFIVIAVPTPIDKDRDPDLSYVESATEIVAKNMKKDSIIVYESTVYPGVTEEVCIPILENISRLKCKQDFKIGYSPERINPGDKIRTIDNIIKIVSGIDDETLNYVAEIYSKIIKAGVFRADSIKVAEAAKVIENTQRDLNIALMNELSLIFDKMDIDVMKVIEAAGSKWNFHHYHPGLVGGHCISVDPHYLLYKSKKLGYDPKVILAGRDVNEHMPIHIANRVTDELDKINKNFENTNILVMGLTFKDNVNDIRNSKIKITINHLLEKGLNIYAYEPLVDKETIKNKFDVNNIDPKNTNLKFDCIIIARNHKIFDELSFNDIKKIMNEKPIMIDVAYRFDKKEAKNNGFVYKSF